MMETRRTEVCSFTVLGMPIVLGLSGCTLPLGFHSPGSNIQIEWIAFVQFRGIYYVAQGLQSPSQSKQKRVLLDAFVQTMFSFRTDAM
jgi:hypothetical protein